MPSQLTEGLLAALKKCRETKDLQRAQQLYAFMYERNLDTHIVLGDELVTTMLDSGASLVDVQDLFDKLPCRSERCWTSLISTHVYHCRPEIAFSLFQSMQQDHCQPSTHTYVSLLKACASHLTNIDMGMQIHASVVKVGLETHRFIGNTLVGMYGKFGSLAEASYVSQSLPSRDIVSWNALIAGYAEYGYDEQALVCLAQMEENGFYPNVVTLPSSLKACGNAGAIDKGLSLCADIVRKGLEGDVYVGSSMVDMYAKCGLVAEADNVLSKLPDRSVVSWNALIAGYADHELSDEALGSFERMQFEGLSPDDSTFLSTLKACGNTGAIEIGQKLHMEILKRGLEGGLFVSNSLVDMYGQCGALSDGRVVFNKICTSNVASWSAMMKAYGDNHQVDMAMQCFMSMQDIGVIPNSITFTCLLGACSHASLVSEGQRYFKLMTQEYRIEPTLDHLSCMVDLLARSGNIFEAQRFIDAMECIPSEDNLKALLTGCRVHGEVELGLKVFSQLVQLNKEDTPAYMMMTDIYAAAGRWDDANLIEASRCDMGARKKLACAWIEVESKIHDFAVGNKVSENISTAIRNLNSRIRIEGCMPVLDLIIRYS